MNNKPKKKRTALWIRAEFVRAMSLYHKDNELGRSVGATAEMVLAPILAPYMSEARAQLESEAEIEPTAA